jgi:hypothetical protein
LHTFVAGDCLLHDDTSGKGHSTVTRLAIVGCTEAAIATITGHSLRDVHSILDANYLHRDPALGESAIRKLERGMHDK